MFFLEITHKRVPISHPSGWVWRVFCDLNVCVSIAIISVLGCVIWYYIGPRYIDSPLIMRSTVKIPILRSCPGAHIPLTLSLINLTLKHREAPAGVISTVATDALVLKHQAISTRSTDYEFMTWGSFTQEIYHLWETILKNIIPFWKKSLGI